MSKRKIFYPFNYHSYSLIHYLNLSFDKLIVASDIGSGLIDKDISYSINSNENEGLIVQNFKDIRVYENDELYLLDDEVKLDINCITHSLEEKTKNIDVDMPLIDLEIPVILIGGLFDSIFNSKLIVDLKYNLENMGIKCGIISSDKYLKYIGASILDFENINYSSIPELYYFIKKETNIMYQNNVDVLLIQAQGGFMQMNDTFFNDFGIYYTLLNEVTNPDFRILTLPEMYSDEIVVKEIQEVSCARYGECIDYFYVKNFFIDNSNPFILTSMDDITFLENEKDNLSTLISVILRKLGDDLDE